MLDVVTLSSDAGPPEAARRTKCFAVSGHHRLLVVAVSGGMMDLGWAQRGLPALDAPAQRFVEGIEPDFAAATATVVHETRKALTTLERNERLYCNVQMVALERGERFDQLARIGGMQVVSFGSSSVGTRLGSEDVLSLSPGERPVVVTASLIPDVHWMTDKDQPGWILLDETAEATRMADHVRRDVYEETTGTALLVITHPFWAEIDMSRLRSLSDDAAVREALRDLVNEASPHRTDAMAVIVAPPPSRSARQR